VIDGHLKPPTLQNQARTIDVSANDSSAHIDTCKKVTAKKGIVEGCSLNSNAHTTNTHSKSTSSHAPQPTPNNQQKHDKHQTNAPTTFDSEQLFVIPLIQRCDDASTTAGPKPGEVRRLKASEIDLPEFGATVPITPYLCERTLQHWLQNRLLLIH